MIRTPPRSLLPCLTLSLGLTVLACPASAQAPPGHAPPGHAGAAHAAPSVTDDDLAGATYNQVQTGKVLETMDAGGYTYVHLETPAGKIWLAMPKTPVTTGEERTFAGGYEMADFTSRTLGRTFKRITFSPGPVVAAQTAKHAATGKIADRIAPPTQQRDLKVPRATGPDARSVAEVHAQRKALDGKRVVVRAKVVKVSPRVIQGKWWAHGQDGSGDSKAKSHDLIFTAAKKPPIGGVLLFTGTVKTDVDLGMGYRYEVLVEGATFSE